jgi:plastocyanin
MSTKLFTTLILFATLLTACSPAATPAPAQAVPTQAASGNEVQINISGFKYDPASITIKVGTTVTWTNNDTASHTVTADDGSWTSDNLANGATYSHTFDKAGTYPYHCNFHSGMKATIIVQP